MARTRKTTTKTTRKTSTTKRASKTTTKAAAPKKTVQAAPAGEVVMKLTHDEIANRAYFKWLAKGKPSGSEMSLWLEAESELKKSA
ncbi:DUF2934 domain-containing protein [Mucisphaera calidilacus]|uniref:DUF2934 domain-containing protein n=1 Tax=Mucisphaera calidilacus TaxID=2527982 RepID=A0A518BXW6_9BACT|nr:DUF2934 domain-containing protein [Mucisphaera calidilacus]QDU71798.1 hypothetical protein Pan265_16510 [Mucisphaera calidilacus]